jgi:DNA-directed RNA polymerase subunit N (RpoN/RPB10)
MLCHLQQAYEKKLNDIVNNPKMSDEDKDSEKEKLVNSFGLRRYCCVMRLMTYKRLIEIVK